MHESLLHYTDKRFSRFGGDVTARSRDEANHSAVTLAAAQGHLELVDLLLDNSSMIDIATKLRVRVSFS